MKHFVVLIMTFLLFGIGGCKKDHCDDGEHNQDETGVDCGGVDCNACEDCFDGIQNRGETGIDCGGTCKACDLKWAKVRSGDQKLMAIDFLNNVVVAVGANGRVIKSADAGKTWSTLNSGVTETLTNVQVFSETNFFISGNSDHILSSSDGQTFSTFSTGKTSDWKDIHFIHPDSGTVCGSKMRIMFTDDGGKTWVEKVSAKPTSSNSFYSMSFLNRDEAYVIGGSQLLRTLNGGKTWSPVNAFENAVSPEFNNFRDVYYRTTSDVFCITESGMFISRNSAVWADKLRDVGGGNITFYKQHGLYTGRNTSKSEGKVLISFDGGVHWQQEPLDKSIEFTDGIIISEDIMVAVGDKGTVYRRDK